MRKLILSVIVILAVITAICPSWARSSTNRRIVAIRREMTQMKSMPFGGYSNQMKASENFQSMGYRTRGQLIRSQQNSPATPAGGNEMSAFGIVMTCIGGGILAALIVFGCIFASNGAGRRHLVDPNHECAKAAKSPDNVGERVIISATARGDYHRETVISEEVGVARELARKASMERIYAMFASRQPGTVNNFNYVATEKPKSEEKKTDVTSTSADELKKALEEAKKSAEEAKKSAEEAKKSEKEAKKKTT